MPSTFELLLACICILGIVVIGAKVIGEYFEKDMMEDDEQ